MQQDPGRGPHPESHLVMVAFLSSQAVFLRVVVVICGHVAVVTPLYIKPLFKTKEEDK